jgi:putative transposase
MRKPYPTDLSDAEWTCLRSYLPTRKAGGRPRTHSLRDIFDAIFSHLEKRLFMATFAPRLPALGDRLLSLQKKFRLSGAWGLIYRALRSAARKRVGKNPDALAAIMDSQSVKTAEEGARSNGYDAHKRTSRAASGTCW